jgi:hypothetical protein
VERRSAEQSSEDSDVTPRLLEIRIEDEVASKMRASHVRAQYVCNIVDITANPEQQRLGNLMAKFQDLAVRET